MQSGIFRSVWLVMFILMHAAAVAAELPNPGDTRIATWHDDKTAVFLLMFDDSWPSHVQVAVPALVARDMIATFYINPGKGEFRALRQAWEQEVWRAGMVYGNHTMTHQGVRNIEHAEQEIGQCNQAIYAMVPGPNPRLISWAKPGVPADRWNITPEQPEQLLAKHHLIDRPPFRDRGAVYHLQTAEQMLALADQAIAAGGMEYLIIHGVEKREPLNTRYQDFWPLNQEVFFTLLDGLALRRDRGDLWITDHVSYHQYRIQRTTARVAVEHADTNSIRLRLTCDADPQFYDLPLTLVTRVPAPWGRCQIAQGETVRVVDVEDGLVRFDATPHGDPIHMQPATP